MAVTVDLTIIPADKRTPAMLWVAEKFGPSASANKRWQDAGTPVHLDTPQVWDWGRSSAGLSTIVFDRDRDATLFLLKWTG